MVALHKANHHSPTKITLTGVANRDIQLSWGDSVDQQMLNSYNDELLTIHSEAMYLASLGDVEARKGNTDRARQYYEEAYQKERQVALQLDDSNSNVVGQAILLRSAATLAVQCGRGREAENLVSLGLRKDIPNFLVAQLRDVLKQVDALQENSNDNNEVIELHIPREDHSFLSSLVTRMGWKASFRKVAVL